MNRFVRCSSQLAGLAVVLAVVLLSTSALAEKKKIAIVPFESPNRHSLGEMGANAVEYFEIQLIKSGKVRVFERKQMQRILKEHEFNMTGLVDPGKITKVLGNIVPVDFLLMGKIVYLGDSFSITSRLVDMESAELVLADETTFRDVRGLRIAVKSLAKKFAAAAAGEEVKASASEMFLNTDPKHFYRAAELLTKKLERSLWWDIEGEVGDVDSGSKKVKVEIKRGPNEIYKGVRMEVFRDETGGMEKIGEIYVQKHKKGKKELKAKYYKKGAPEDSDFQLGDKVLSRDYKARIAIGNIVDEVEDHEALVKKFRETMIEKLMESRKLGSVEYDEIQNRLDKINGPSEKKKMKKIHKKGVDYIVLGKFYGRPGDRRTDFKVYNAYTGKVILTVKFDTRL